MKPERAVKVVLVLVGLVFLAGVYPLTIFFSREPALAMMLSLYVTLGIFLLLAARNPSASQPDRLHCLVKFCPRRRYGGADIRNEIQHRELVGVALFFIIGATLIALAPARQSGELASTASA